MITTLAPLGATHTIVLTLAYGELPPLKNGEPNPLVLETTRLVTVTAILKPKGDGESRTLQFTGPAIDVEKEIAEKLPLAVTKIAAHVASLAELDAELEAEKKKKADDLAAAKKEKPKPAPAPAKPAPAKPKAEKPKPPQPTVESTKAAITSTQAKLDAIKAAARAKPAPAPVEDPAAALQQLAGLFPVEEVAL